MIYCSAGSPHADISKKDLAAFLTDAFDKIGRAQKVLIIPPDGTRPHSMAGDITLHAYRYFKHCIHDILPALGTHIPMSDEEKSRMFGSIPLSLFRNHDWRKDVITLGRVPLDYCAKVSGRAISFDWPAQANTLVAEGGHDLILSIGQVVPHEVAGMAGYNKNIFVGTGGKEGIDKSHFLGAVCGIESILGMSKNPVRDVFDYASARFLAQFPIVYIQTVVSMNDECRLCLRGVFIGDDKECFDKAAELSREANITRLRKPIKKAVVALDPEAYKSTWLGNKAIYRTRKAIETGGELVVIAPGVERFGEDGSIDRIIRRYGYSGREQILELAKTRDDLRDNLSGAAHLIHGSSEGRFTITYCTDKLGREEIEGVGYRYSDIGSIVKRYDPKKFREGWNTMQDDEEIYFISHPGLGLWEYCK
jgi:nickel-dependent lactate racemase